MDGICCFIRRISAEISVGSLTVAGVTGVAVVIVGAINGLYVEGALVVVMLGAADGLYVAEGDGVLKCPTVGTGTAAAVVEGAANGLYTGGVAVGATNGLYPSVTPEAGAPNRLAGGGLSNSPIVSPGTCAVVGYNGEKDGLYTGGADDAVANGFTNGAAEAGFGALNRFAAAPPNMLVFGASENGELSGLDDAGVGPPPNTGGVLGPPNSGGAVALDRPVVTASAPKAVANILPEAAAAAVLIFRVPKRPPLIAGVAVTACAVAVISVRTKKLPTHHA